MQHISNKHGIKIQHIEGILTSITTILENLSTSTSVLQTTMESILPYVQNRDDSINILNTANNSPRAITTANPVLTAKVPDKMCYFNGFDNFEPQTSDDHYVYDFELGPKNRKNKKITQNYVGFFIKEFDIQFEETQTNEKWNEATITKIAEAYFKPLKKERKTTPAMKLQNDYAHDAISDKSYNRLAALNKIFEEQLSYSKSEVEKLFSFEATSPEVSNDEETVSSSNDQNHRSESRKKL
ncbi:hypothetical protein F8M41_008348 [Gigaspora margarita]|uniref:Uncharacterized protein n=1 Tax=Gigaspora margarita TaxID=4874 RepID=A0A8H3X3J7_GIGMA|nr:hypothetical protein F8M41_008348 [Gigaspora margarita]